jgi:hypothetical protein
VCNQEYAQAVPHVRMSFWQLTVIHKVNRYVYSRCISTLFLRPHSHLLRLAAESPARSYPDLLFLRLRGKCIRRSSNRARSWTMMKQSFLRSRFRLVYNTIPHGYCYYLSGASRQVGCDTYYGLIFFLCYEILGVVSVDDEMAETRKSFIIISYRGNQVKSDNLKRRIRHK